MPENHTLSHPPLTLLGRRYLDIVEGLKTATASSAIRSHLFRLLKPELDRDETLRNKIAAAKVPPSGKLDDFRAVLQEIDDKVKVSVKVPTALTSSQSKKHLGQIGDRRQSIRPRATARCLAGWRSRTSVRRPCRPKSAATKSLSALLRHRTGQARRLRRQ